ncbi:hypothetical protein [Rhizobium rosettiformans]|uniref:hypothetical protein n=1 Tax=Rhizobium rosettiformans TaxID=1368430 RepID=UPI0028610277|nr:hypothetical protein [Rhizobium rosettiformans]MDR7028019.1 hypothetical protein [Rhizobium rosettiformans]MDR7064699.1 hypothetical protein [Rhizobium rosettiformans]
MAGLFGTNAQIRPIQKTAIQPTGIPGSTFVRPQQREVGGNARALAEALGSMNSALQNYAVVTKSTEEDPNARANKEQVARLQQMNREQLAAEIASGSLDGKRVQQDAAEVLLAERANDDLRKRWSEYYNTEFDRSNGNAAEEFERMRSEIAAGLPSEVSRGHLYRLSNDFGRAWLEKDAEEKTAIVKGEIGTTVVGSFRATIDDAIGLHGKSPKDAARMVFEKSAANRIFLGMSGQEQNETIYAIAEEYALKGQVDVARELLSADRVGADGRKVPSLMSTREYGTKALRLIKQAESVAEQEFLDKDLNSRLGIEEKVRNGEFTKRDAEEFKGKVPDSYLTRQVLQSEENRARIFAKEQGEEVKSQQRVYAKSEENRVYSEAAGVLSRMGGINRLRDQEVPSPTGEGTRTITVKQQVDAVVQRMEDGWANERDQLVSQGMDPDQAQATVDAKRLDWYAGQKLENEEWDNLLNGFAGRAASDTVLQGGETAKYLVKNAELYRRLKAGNPAYLRTFLTDDSSRAMLDHYDRLVTRNRMPPEEALRVAAGWSSQSPWERASNRQISAKDEQDLVDDLIDDLNLDDRSSDRQYLTGEIRQMAENENMTLKEIKRELPKRLADSTVVINGVLVPDHRDLPPDFPPLMEQYLSDIRPMMLQRGRTDEDNDQDLYVRPVSGQSKWEIASKKYGGTGFFVLPKDLAVLLDKKERSDREIADKLIKAKAEEQAKYMEEYRASIESERQTVLKWERRAESNPSRLNRYVAEKLRDNLNERIANDLTVSERAEARKAEALKKMGEAKARGERIDRTLSNFFRSLVPTVKIGGQTVLGDNANPTMRIDER